MWNVKSEGASATGCGNSDRFRCVVVGVRHGYRAACSSTVPCTERKEGGDGTGGEEGGVRKGAGGE